MRTTNNKNNGAAGDYLKGSDMVDQDCYKVIVNELEHIKATLARIEEQAKRTNGRVTALENWRIALVSAVAVLAATKWPILGVLLQGFGG